MNAFTRRTSIVLLAAAVLGCGKELPVEERAAKACRGFASRHLFDPLSARFTEVEVRQGSGEAYWDVRFVVEAKAASGDMKRERATCRLAADLDLIEIVGG
jgi:hypothetical protein